MVKFDLEKFKYLNKEDFRVLTAVEMGMKNHEFVPSQLLYAIANCKGSRTFNILKEMCRQKLLAYEKSKQGEGYRLTFTGFDVLALNVLIKRDVITQFGSKIGVGKESDIYVAMNDNKKRFVIKFHRLGRNSFRKIKEKRDYMGKRCHSSWLYLSRLAATKEFEFLKILHKNGFPVPKPIDCNRHCIVMEHIDGFPLYHINDLEDAPSLYNECITLALEFAQYGLIHGDFNEYNLIYCENYKNENKIKIDNNGLSSIVNNQGHIVVIDFPQMVSIDHLNADFYFNRDIKCIYNFFRRKFNFIAKNYPSFDDIIRTYNLDKEVYASGFTKEIDSYLINHIENLSLANISPTEGGTSNDEFGHNESHLISNNTTVDMQSSDIEDNNNNVTTEAQPICDSSSNHDTITEISLDKCPTNHLNQIYELLDSEKKLSHNNRIDDNTALKVNDLNFTEKYTIATSTFTHAEISNKIRRDMKLANIIEKHKRALKLSVKKGDSYRSRTRKENTTNIKEFAHTFL